MLPITMQVLRLGLENHLVFQRAIKITKKCAPEKGHILV